MEERYADNASNVINPDHNFCSANSAIEETYTKGVRIELNHDYYRFAYDLVEKVLEVRGELNPHVKPNLPEPTNYLFTKEHADIINTLLINDNNYMLEKVHQFVNGVYDYYNYIPSRDLFVREWKNRAYTEKSFISACASIAHVAAQFTQMNYYCGALDDVVIYIASWIADILERGTIESSSWG